MSEKQLTDEQYEAAKKALFQRWPVTSPEGEAALAAEAARALVRVIEAAVNP